MNPWKKLASLCAVALSLGVLARAPEARAQTAMDNDEIIAEEADVNEAESAIVDPYHYDYGHRGCRSYCNNRFARCLDRAYRGYGYGYGGWRGHYRRAYDRCDDQRDYCILSCRGRGYGYGW